MGRLGYLDTPARPNGAGVVLTHGAGSNCRSALLLAVAEGFLRAGTHVLRYDLPFRQQRPTGPPRSAGAEDRKGLVEAVHELRRLVRDDVYLAGHSYGGRQASIVATEEPGICDGLLLLSYPLHPPKEPWKIRTEHFPRLTTPALFVHGSKDPFATAEELSTAVGKIPGITAIIMVENAAHDLRKGSFEVGKQVIEPFTELIKTKRQQSEQSTQKSK